MSMLSTDTLLLNETTGCGGRCYRIYYGEEDMDSSLEEERDVLS